MTPIFPGNFLLLAGTGTLLKAIGRTVARPAYRVIQTHFSKTDNYGDVEAKEILWEVLGQLTGK